jgi:hypothetical protein
LPIWNKSSVATRFRASEQWETQAVTLGFLGTHPTNGIPMFRAVFATRNNGVLALKWQGDAARRAALAVAG